MCDFFDLTCFATAGAESALEGIALSAGEAAALMISQGLTFWVATPSIDPDTALVRQLQGYTMPVVVLMLVGSIIIQAIRMMVTRKKDPAINIALGLLRFASVNAIGLTVMALALRAGDAFAEALVNRGIADFALGLGGGLFAAQAAVNPFGTLALAGLAWVLGFLQMVVTILRQGGLLVLAVLMILAAAGSTKDLAKMGGWIIALIAYKPAAALIYTSGFTLMGAGQDFNTIVTGMVVLFLAIVAMPAMLKFFSFTTVAIAGGAGLGGVVAAGALGAVSLAALRGGGSAAQTAQSREQTMPGTSSAGHQANPSGSAGSGGPLGGGASGGPWGGGDSGGPGGGGSGPRPEPGGSSGPPPSPGTAPSPAGTSAAGAGSAGGAAAAGPAAPGVFVASQAVQGAQQAVRGAAGAMTTPPQVDNQPRSGPGGAPA